jgi:hypothetical protein
MSRTPLFNLDDVPSTVVSPTGVTKVNGIIEELRKKRIDQLEVSEPESRFRVSNMVSIDFVMPKKSFAAQITEGQFLNCLKIFRPS